MAKNKKSARTMTATKKEEIFNRWLELRNNGLSVYEAAKIVGVTYQTLHKWERGHNGGEAQPTGRPPKATQKKFIVGKTAAGQPTMTVVETPVAVLPSDATPPASAKDAAPKAPVIQQPVAVKPKAAPQAAVKETPRKASVCPPQTGIIVTTPSGFTVICPDVETARQLIA